MAVRNQQVYRDANILLMRPLALPTLLSLVLMFVMSLRVPTAPAAALNRERLQRNLLPRRSPILLRRLSGAPEVEKLQHIHPESVQGLARRNNALIEVQPSHVPVYTASGFTIIATPEFVQEDLLTVLQQSRNTSYWEFPEHSFSLLSEFPNGTATSRKIDVPQRQQSFALYQLGAAVARWSNQSVSLPKFYGLRQYRRGSTLGMHLDAIRQVRKGHLDARVLSAIVHVAQRTEEDWPLCIEDNDGRLHNVTMQPGQTILYESARLAHGRPFPLIGDEYVSAFIHFKPSSWSSEDAETARGRIELETAALIQKHQAFELRHGVGRVEVPS